MDKSELSVFRARLSNGRLQLEGNAKKVHEDICIRMRGIQGPG